MHMALEATEGLEEDDFFLGLEEAETDPVSHVPRNNFEEKVILLRCLWTIHDIIELEFEKVQRIGSPIRT